MSFTLLPSLPSHLLPFYRLLFITLTVFCLDLCRAEGLPTERIKPSKQIVISVGASTYIPSRSSNSIARNGPIIVEEQGSQLKITGKVKGFTHIVQAGQITEIYVLDAKEFQTYQLLQDILKSLMGLRVEINSSKVTIAGTLLRLKDWLRLAELRSEDFKFIASMKSGLQEEAQTYFRNQLKLAQLPIVNLKLSDGALAYVPKEYESLAPQYRSLLSPYGFDIVTSAPQSFASEPLVRIQIVIAELRKSEFENLGVKWPSEITASVQPRPEIQRDISLEIQALAQRGLAQVLASPNLLCRSGKEAEFHSGGEFPIRLVSARQREVTWKRHGLYVLLRPIADPSGRLSIFVKTEISVIDPSQTVDGVPGLLSNEVQSHFDLEKGATVALSGLTKREWGRGKSGLPLLSQIPVLGRLFSSQSYLMQESELVVFVTPQVLNPSTVNETVKMPEGWGEN